MSAGSFRTPWPTRGGERHGGRHRRADRSGIDRRARSAAAHRAGSRREHDRRSPPRAVDSFGEHVAIRHKQDGAWLDVTYTELGEIVREIALGLIDLGIQPGERVCILAGTRPEWTYADLAITAIGAVVVPIYPTNSPEECHWVISDSGACAIVCENAEQLAKVAAVRDRLPELRTVIVIDADGSGPERHSRSPAASSVARARGPVASDGSGRARAPPRGAHPRGPLHLHLHLRHHRARRRGACSPTATTAPWSTWCARSGRSTTTRSPTCSCRSPTRSRC